MISRPRQWTIMGAVAVAVTVVTWAASLLSQATGRMPAALVAEVLLAGVVIATTLVLEHRGWRELGFSSRHPWWQAAWCAILTAGLGLVFIALPLACGLDPAALLPAKPASAGALVGQLCFLILVAGPVQELVLRGYFLGRLRYVTQSAVAGVALSALLGGAWLLIAGGGLLQAGIYTLIGAVLALARWRVRVCSTLTVGVAHGLFAAIALLLAFILV